MEKPKCKLLGTDGNIFALLAKASQTLKKAKQYEQAQSLVKEVFSASSYDHALQIIMEYVDVE